MMGPSPGDLDFWKRRARAWKALAKVFAREYWYNPGGCGCCSPGVPNWLREPCEPGIIISQDGYFSWYYEQVTRDLAEAIERDLWRDLEVSGG